MSALVCVCLMVATVSEVSGQRPFYAPRPWYDRFGNNNAEPDGAISGGSSSSSSSSSTTTSSNNNNNGNNNAGSLPDRFLTPAEGNRSFKYYNNVPIEGPDTPCVGCTYTLTRNGFVRT
jgi:hypothetical protein